MDKYLDKLFDIITYSTVAVCFISATVYIVTSGGDTGQIYNAGLLIGLGIVLSLFLVWVKSWSKK